MTYHIHTCSPGCTECDRALGIAADLLHEVFTPFELQEVASELRALHAQREALTQEVARLREQLALPVRQHWRELPWEHWKPEDKP